MYECVSAQQVVPIYGTFTTHLVFYTSRRGGTVGTCRRKYFIKVILSEWEAEAHNGLQS
jgi:hypothetical protein